MYVISVLITQDTDTMIQDVGGASAKKKQQGKLTRKNKPRYNQAAKDGKTLGRREVTKREAEDFFSL